MRISGMVIAAAVLQGVQNGTIKAHEMKIANRGFADHHPQRPFGARRSAAKRRENLDAVIILRYEGESQRYISTSDRGCIPRSPVRWEMMGSLGPIMPDAMPRWCDALTMPLPI